jgi:hypothetical protein
MAGEALHHGAAKGAQAWLLISRSTKAILMGACLRQRRKALSPCLLSGLRGSGHRAVPYTHQADLHAQRGRRVAALTACHLHLEHNILTARLAAKLRHKYRAVKLHGVGRLATQISTQMTGSAT